MHCPQCGTGNLPTARFCSRCGAPLPESGEASPSGSDQFAPWYESAHSRPSPMGAPSMPVRTHLVQSILVTLCCCQILGIVAIVYSAMAHAKNSEGQYAEARELAGKANTWGILGIVLGLILGFIWLLVSLSGMEF